MEFRRQRPALSAALLIVAALLLLAASSFTVAGAAAAKPDPFKVCATTYWLAVENTPDQDNDGNDVTLSGKRTEKLTICDPATSRARGTRAVPAILLWKCCLEGTCWLATGEVFNKIDDSDCSKGLGAGGVFRGYKGLCFEQLPSGAKWGLGSQGNRLVPFVSAVLTGRLPDKSPIAGDNLYGKTVLVKELVGHKVPGSKKLHNGCVRVDDRCDTGCARCSLGAHMDLFVGLYRSSVAMALPERFTVTPKACKVQKYV